MLTVGWAQTAGLWPSSWSQNDCSSLQYFADKLLWRHGRRHSLRTTVRWLIEWFCRPTRQGSLPSCSLYGRLITFSDRDESNETSWQPGLVMGRF